MPVFKQILLSSASAVDLEILPPDHFVARLVQLTVNVEIINQHTEKPLWQRQGLTTEGDYDPGNELAGRARALDRLTVNIVEGAQSQW